MKEKTSGQRIAMNILLVIGCAVAIAEAILMIIEIAVNGKRESGYVKFKDTDLPIN